MKNKLGTIILIVLLSLVTAVLIGVLYLGITGKLKFINGIKYKITSNEIYNETITDEFDLINIKSTAAEIIINESKEESFKIVVNGKEKSDFKLTKDNKELNLKFEPKECKGICLNVEIGRIELNVPENYENKIRIENNFGDIKVAKLVNASIKIKEDAGDVEIKEAKEVNVDNKYGDIKIDKAIIVDASEAAGDVKIGELEEAIVKNSYGDVIIDTLNGRVDVKLSCGDIDINNLVLNKNSSISNDFGDIKIGKTNEIFIEAETDLGEVKINNNNRKSDITLTLKNDCGDIKVNN